MRESWTISFFLISWASRASNFSTFQRSYQIRIPLVISLLPPSTFNILFIYFNEQQRGTWVRSGGFVLFPPLCCEVVCERKIEWNFKRFTSFDSPSLPSRSSSVDWKVRAFTHSTKTRSQTAERKRKGMFANFSDVLQNMPNCSTVEQSFMIKCWQSTNHSRLFLVVAFTRLLSHSHSRLNQLNNDSQSKI